MTAVALPSLTRPWQAQWQYLDFGTDAIPPLGGVAQRAARLGNRHAVTFSTLPGLDANCGAALMAALSKARATGSTVSVAWPQPPFATAIGTPLVNGASQSGLSLIVDGFTASTTALKAGRFFSLSVSSRNYLYALTDDLIVNGSGQATIALDCMLRASPADNAAIEFHTPLIEGFVDGMTQSWTVEMLANYGVPAFTIREIK